MNRFEIPSGLGQCMDSGADDQRKEQFLFHSIKAFYHSGYQSGNATQRNSVGTVENIICTLKNQFRSTKEEALTQAANSLIEILKEDLPLILRDTRKDNLTVCVVPRAKAQNKYSSSQLVFKRVVAAAVKVLSGFSDGTNYIIRHTDTRTTHMDKSGYGGDGDLPYPGITKDTCNISSEIKGKDILLIDDLYTKTVNIDEDAIQALLDNGASSVVFYAIGKTLERTFGN